MKVAVLAGGTSAEREVSLSSAASVVKALLRGGHAAAVIDPGDSWKVIDPEAASPRSPRRRGGLPDEEAAGRLAASDIVLNMLHGGQGEDGTVNAALELLGRPYVGSRPGPCAAAMNKVVSKRLFSSAGVPTPEYLVLESAKRDSWEAEVDEALPKIGLPAIVKPAEEGSTVGLSKAGSRNAVLEAIGRAASLSRQVLVERFIAGRELTVGVVDGQALPVLEVVVPGGFYDFQAKYRSQANKYICPAEIDSTVAGQAQRLALAAFHVLGLEDYARIDFRLADDGSLWCLEANNQPGMTDSSLLPKAARVSGLDLTALLDKLMAGALARFSGSAPLERRV